MDMRRLNEILQRASREIEAENNAWKAELDEAKKRKVTVTVDQISDIFATECGEVFRTFKDEEIIGALIPLLLAFSSSVMTKIFNNKEEN